MPATSGASAAPTTMTAATSSTMPDRGELPRLDRVDHGARRPTAVFSPSGLATPSAAGTCWRKMMVAMPTVKPSTTGQGM